MRYFICFLLLCQCAVGQVKLSSHHLSLKKPGDQQQILSALNSQTGEMTIFATDKEQVYSHKYNSALFLTDSLHMPRPEKSYTHMAGYSIAEEGYPELYWASDDLKQIMVTRYVYQNGLTSNQTFALAFEKEWALATFSTNNTFYILTKLGSQEKLKLYSFKEGEMQTQVLDFSAYSFTDKHGTVKKLGVVLDDYPIQLIDVKLMNPLFLATPSSKLYIDDKKITFTLDQNQDFTQLFEIDLDTYAFAAKKYLHDATASKPAAANSYLLQDKLFQIQRTGNTIAVSSKQVQSGNLIGRNTLPEQDEITFKNSPLFIQTGNQRPRELKNTKKYISRLKNIDIGITAYRTPESTMLTIGGVGYVQTAGNTILSVTAGIGITLAAGGDFSAIEALESQQPQSVYFESLFDDEFKHLNIQQSTLAADHVSQFTFENPDITHQTLFAYKDYMILGYYDGDAKQYVMRKFVDDGKNEIFGFQQ